MRHRLVTLLGSFALVAVVFLVLPAQPAAACSCAGGTDEEQFARADAVFTGRLVDRQDPDNSGISSSADFATLRFEVDVVYKGAATVDQAVVTEQSGASCGLEIQGDGPFLVFALQSHYDQAVPEGTLYAGLCGGTRPLDMAPLPDSFGSAEEPTIAETDAQAVALPTPGTTAPSLDDADDAGAPLLLIGGLAVAAVIGGGAIVFVRRRRTAGSA